jgi:hypothetical protein
VESKKAFDISVNNQLFTKYFDDFIVQKPFETRKYLACFRGTRFFRREAGNRIRTKLNNLHDGSDFLVMTRCHQWERDNRNDSSTWNGDYTGEHIKESSIPTAQELKQCKKDQENGHEHHWNYTYMLNECKFSLCPRGMGPHSYRLNEALQFGSIPIILSDGYVMPFSDIIPWDNTTLTVPYKFYESIPDIIRKMNEKK